MTTTSHRAMRTVIESCFPPSYKSDADRLRAWSLVFRLLEINDRHPCLDVLHLREHHPYQWAVQAALLALGQDLVEDAPGLALLVARHEAEVWSMRMNGRAP